MAYPWTVGYDSELTATERAALEARDDAFSSAFLGSHFWIVVFDSKQRRYLRALGYSDRKHCFGQFVLVDIDTVSDEQDFKNRIISGDFCCTELP